MIRIIPIFLTLFFPLSIFSETIWLNSIEDAMEKARIEDRPILVDLYTDWCTYCKDLENKIFPSQNVAIEIKKYITVRINGDESKDIVTKYSVRGYPTILLLDKNGNFIDKITGLPGKDMLVTKLQEGFRKKDVETGLLNEQKEFPNRVLTNYNLGLFYYQNGKFKNSSEYFLKSYNASDINNSEKKPDALFLLGLIQIQEKKFPEAISIWNSYIEKYPESKKDSILYCRGISYYFHGMKKEAREDLLKAKELSTSRDQLEKIQMFLSELGV